MNRMEKKIYDKIVASIIMFAAISLASCSQDEWSNHLESPTDKYVTSISVNDNGYSPTKDLSTTRSIDNGSLTTFTEGDMIGLFAKQGEGANTKFVENICLVASIDENGALTWNPKDGSNTALKEMKLSANATYYAYYPYKGTDVINMKALVTDHWDQPEVEGFFSEAVEVWKSILLNKNQQEHTQYTQGDLMAAKGTISIDPETQKSTLRFAMKHLLGLTILDFTKAKNCNNITFTDFSPYQPEPSKPVYHYIIPNDIPVTLSGSYTDEENQTQVWKLTTRTKSGTYNRYTIKNEGDIEVDPNRPYYKNVKVGDYYLNTGWITNDLSTLKEGVYPIGIVFYTSNPIAPTTGDPILKKEHPDCQHGLAMALTEFQSAWHTVLPTDCSVGEWIDDYATQYTSIRKWKASSAPSERIYGYNNTQALKAYNNAPENAQTPVIPIQKLIQFQTECPVPAQYCSNWFLPSKAELVFMHRGETLSTVNSKLEEVRLHYQEKEVTPITASSQESPYSTNYERSDNETLLICVHSGRKLGEITTPKELEKDFPNVRYRPIFAF